MLCSPNLFTAIAPNSVKSIPGFLGLRAHLLVGLSMNSRNGHEATASRARGSVGNWKLGSVGKIRRPVPKTEQSAVRVEEVFRNLRRDCFSLIKDISKSCWDYVIESASFPRSSRPKVTGVAGLESRPRGLPNVRSDSCGYCRSALRRAVPPAGVPARVRHPRRGRGGDVEIDRVV